MGELEIGPPPTPPVPLFPTPFDLPHKGGGIPNGVVSQFNETLDVFVKSLLTEPCL